MKKDSASFILTGSLMTMIFLIIVNYLTSPYHPWSIYTTMGLLLWPIGFYCIKKRKHKLLSFSFSTLIIIFLVVENLIDTPDYPWSLYAIYPILWWPLLVSLGKRANSMAIALIGSSSIILYYLVLNLLLSPGYPWVIYPAFAVLWWPLSIYHARKNTPFEFSIHASLLIIAFFISVNVISTPDTVWAVYPIFCVLWWPLSMYYFVYKGDFKSD